MSVRGRVAPIETLLHVDVMGVSLKQNARISRVRVFKLPGAPAIPMMPVVKSVAAPKKAAKKKK
jgi:hypothetical protein